VITSLIVDLIVTVLIALIATHYHRFYSHYCQFDEPFTRWFSRIAEAFPWFWWPLQVALIVVSAGAAKCAPHAWWVIGIEGLLFMGWFIWHIHDYIQAHKGDNPPLKIHFWRFR
jgi:hypothetical protein